ncbi:MAG: SPOR domain-containing protein, partial [Treponema sp.]|nr:SPOR domain-containing protein [Treponema sp.]
MEKKKLLLVAISVGIFLVIVIGAAILVFSPKTDGASYGNFSAGNRGHGRTSVTGTMVTSPQPIAAGSSGRTEAVQSDDGTMPDAPQPATVDAADLVKNSGDVQNIQTPPNATAMQETNFYINGQQTDSYRSESKDGTAAAHVTINVQRPTTAAVPDVPPVSPAPAVNNQAAAVKPAPALAKPAPAKTTAAKPASVAPAPKANPASQTKTVTDYWVQTGSFAAKANAEGVKEKLSNKGIT